MKVFNAYKTGLHAILTNKKMWLLFFLVQFVFALIMVRPLAIGMEELIGQSLLGKSILTGNGANVFVEYLAHKADFITTQKALFMASGMIFLVITMLLKAGAIASFTRKDTFSYKTFFNNCGEFFGRFFRLFLISLVYFIVAFLLYLGIDAILSSGVGDSEPKIVAMKIIGAAILLFLIFLIRMVIDYAKIMTVKTDEKKMFKTSFRAWVFVIKHPAKTLGLFYFTGLIGLLIWAVYYFPGGLIPAAGFGIVLMFFWQQLFAFCRNGVNLLFLSSQAALVDSMDT